LVAVVLLSTPMTVSISRWHSLNLCSSLDNFVQG
jgi:hypothetical protein